MSNTGSEILAYCGSCKMDLTAVVVAKVGAKIVKVQCRTCKKEHGYKPAKGVNDPNAAPPPRAKKERTAAEPKAPSVAVEVEWNRKMDELKASPRVTYSPKAKFNVGDVVKHPTFGEGVVTRLQFPDKAEVLFRSDLKLLIHGK